MQLRYTGDGGGVDYPAPRAKVLRGEGKRSPLSALPRPLQILKAQAAGNTQLHTNLNAWPNFFFFFNNHGCSGAHSFRKGNLAHPAVQSWK